MVGIFSDVEVDDSIWLFIRVRFFWLVLGLFGGLGSVYIMKGFDEVISNYIEFFFFIFLIVVMVGNVGV